MLSDVPKTRDSLLIRVRDPQDRDAWEQFSQIYRPVIYRLARGRGMQYADAQDLTQRVLMSVAAAIPDWQRKNDKTRFSHWLRRVAKNAILNALSRGPKDVAEGGSDAALMLDGQTEHTSEHSKAVEIEYRRQLYRRAAEIVRGRADEITWSAFSLTMIDGMSILEAAKQLCRTEGMVYAARSRIIRRLRDFAKTLCLRW